MNNKMIWISCILFMLVLGNVYAEVSSTKPILINDGTWNEDIVVKYFYDSESQSGEWKVTTQSSAEESLSPNYITIDDFLQNIDDEIIPNNLAPENFKEVLTDLNGKNLESGLPIIQNAPTELGGFSEVDIMNEKVFSDGSFELINEKVITSNTEFNIETQELGVGTIPADAPVPQTEIETPSPVTEEQQTETVYYNSLAATSPVAVEDIADDQVVIDSEGNKFIKINDEMVPYSVEVVDDFEVIKSPDPTPPQKATEEVKKIKEVVDTFSAELNTKLDFTYDSETKELILTSDTPITQSVQDTIKTDFVEKLSLNVEDITFDKIPAPEAEETPEQVTQELESEPQTPVGAIDTAKETDQDLMDLYIEVDKLSASEILNKMKTDEKFKEKIELLREDEIYGTLIDNKLIGLVTDTYAIDNLEDGLKKNNVKIVTASSDGKTLQTSYNGKAYNLVSLDENK